VPDDPVRRSLPAACAPRVCVSLSRFIVHDTSEARRPRDDWWTVHGPAVPPARVPGSPQRDGGRVAAPRALLCGRVASAEGTLLRLPSCPYAPHTRPSIV